MCRYDKPAVAPEPARWRKLIASSLAAAFVLLLGQPTRAIQPASAQQPGADLRPLEPGKPTEREIAGGEAHTYEIALTAGQFVRFLLDQRVIDAALTLMAPDGKELVVMNVAIAGEQESLSFEAATAGNYRLTVQAGGVATLLGSYLLEAIVQPTTTAQDRKRLTAEALLVEANELNKQGAKTALQVMEKSEQAHSVWRELGEPKGTAYSIYLIGGANDNLGRYEKAITYYEQALAVTREFKLQAREGRTLNAIGISYFNMSRYEKAIEFFEQARVIFRAVNNKAGEAAVLNNLGNIYHSLGRPDKAIENLELALPIYREVKDRMGEGRACTNLGLVFKSLNRYEKAIESYGQGLAIAREVKNRLNEGRALSALGVVYQNLSRFEKSVEYLEQALAIYREIKDRRSEAAALNNLGVSFRDSNQNEKAIFYFEQGLAIYRELKNRANEGSALNNLGISFRNLGRNEKAIEYHEQALKVAREVKDRVNEGAALGSLGIAYHNLNEGEKAIFYFEQGLAIHREVKNYIEVQNTLYYLARAEQERGNLIGARTHIEEALRIVESLRVDKESVGESPESRASFFASVQQSYQFFTDLLMNQHKTEPEKNFDTLALEVSERQRARVSLDRFLESNFDIREGVDAALIERERTLSQQLNNKALQLMQASKPGQSEALKKEISQLETDYERAQVAIRKASPHYANLTQPQPLKLKEIQAQLDSDTLLLEYSLGEERSYLWAITEETLKSYKLPKEAEIRQSALQVHQLLAARSASIGGESAMQRQQRIRKAEADLPAAAQQLSQLLLAPVAAELGNKRLVVVADGALQYVPFAMLPEPVSGSQQSVAGNTTAANRLPTTDHRPLIVGHEVVSLPSASALAIHRSELASRQAAPKLLAVIADPVFDRSDARCKTAATDASDNVTPQARSFDDQRSLEHLAEKSDDKSGLKPHRLVIPRLPFTRQEATRLLALAPKNSSFAAMDFQASNATVLAGELAQYRYVHFATHGLADTEKPWKSSLVLSMVDAEGKPQDGFLRLKDIYKLKLPAELVVLSACQTGIGKEIKGEGMEALTRGFMYAGAARVVVSLWSVNDKATSELMAKFYEKMLKDGARPAAALRAAQVEMWRQKQWQSPYYWAAFTMQGEWR